MKIKEKTLRKIWNESIATIVIISAVLVISGHVKNIPPTVSALAVSESAMLDAGEIPSQSNNLEEIIQEEVSIEQLVADVNSGKAGNGDARREYLGDKYDEVQAIIEKQYERKIVVTSRSGSTTKNTEKATSGSKAEYQNYAYELVIAMGWSETDFQCLINLWERESGWNPNAHNKSSGAHGIPQSLPASKMSSHGEDYYTNGYTQIKWGLDYILNRYGSPTNAWKHFQNKNWY